MTKDGALSRQEQMRTVAARLSCLYPSLSTQHYFIRFCASYAVTQCLAHCVRTNKHYYLSSAAVIRRVYPVTLLVVLLPPPLPYSPLSLQPAGTSDISLPLPRTRRDKKYSRLNPGRQEITAHLLPYVLHLFGEEPSLLLRVFERAANQNPTGER